MNVEYTLIITNRKSSSGVGGDQKPYERYVGFATNVPEVDPDAYARR